MEVEAAGAVEGFLRGAGREAAGQDGLLVVVVAGTVDGKAPGRGGSGIAQARRNTVHITRYITVWSEAATIRLHGQFRLKRKLIATL